MSAAQLILDDVEPSFDFEIQPDVLTSYQTLSSQQPAAFWRNPLLTPTYISILSITILLVQALFASPLIRNLRSKLARRFKRNASDLEPEADRETIDEEPAYVVHVAGMKAELKEHIKHQGGLTIFAWKLLRLVGCLALVALTIGVVVIEKEAQESVHKNSGILGGWSGLVEALKKKKRKNKQPNIQDEWFTIDEWYQISLCCVFLYTTFLSLLILLPPLPRARRISPHLTFMLLYTSALYFVRDVWPLGTFTLKPADLGLEPSGVVWTRIVLLSIAGLLVPLCIPQTYIPINPKKPQEIPNPEQTTSLLSFLLFTFLDPLIFLAYRTPHLPFEQLPPLCDYDRAEELIKRSFWALDPWKSGLDEKSESGSEGVRRLTKVRQRHIFWGFMQVFWREYAQLAVIIVVRVVVTFAAPLTINRLLAFLETKGVDAIVKPWVWILAMFLGPVVGSMAMQYYIFIATGVLIRVESIITQLVFEHSLRIRMVEKPDSKTGSAPSSVNGGNEKGSEGVSRASTPVSDVEADGEGERERESSFESEATSTTLPGGSSQPPSVGQGPHTAQSSPPSSSSSSPPKSSKPSSSTIPTDAEPDAEGGSSSEKSSNIVGKINNLVTVDSQNVTDSRDFLFLIWYAPLELGLCCWFLYSILEWSAVIGIVVMILCFPIPGYVAKLLNKVQMKRMKRTDERTQGVSEVMSVLRMIKLFAWEEKIQEQLDEKREQELKWIKLRQLLQLANWTLNYIIPLAALLATFSTYTLVLRKELTASKVFSSMAVFDMLRDQLHMVFFMVPQFITGKISLDRIDDFLRSSELLDHFKSSDSASILNGAPEDSETETESRIGFRDATFSWSDEDQSGAVTPSRRAFRLRVEGDLFFKRGEINLIVGPTGSGKTSVLYALLGEMHFIPPEPRSWFNLPRGGGVAYAAQESWVQNETIQSNILFGAPMDEERYQKVLYQCGLTQDLSLFEAGDMTEVGEKGLTLSGGQKARITLARAIYSKAEILLLDDVLAALDVHTAKWIVEKCFRGDLVEGRTVILVTHNVTLASPLAQYVVSLGSDGRILSRGSIDDALRHNSKLLNAIEEDKETTQKAQQTVDNGGKEAKAPGSQGKLIVAEEIALGHVRWPALKLYLASLGGWVFWSVVIGFDLIAALMTTLQTWYLGYWARQYQGHAPSEVSVPKYLLGYSLLLLACIVTWTTAFATFFLGSVRASRTIYNKLTQAILGTTLRWLDVVPTSRVIARCTQDIRAVDGPIASGLVDILDLSSYMIFRLGAVVVFTPFFIVPGILVGLMGAWCGQVYIGAQLSVKREMSNAKSPVLGHFGAAVAGLTSLRAYGAQAAFRSESIVRIDKYMRTGRCFYNLNRWIGIRIDTLGALFASGLAWYLIYIQDSVNASNIGFSLNMAVGFSGAILWLVRILNDFEVQGNSLERIQDYIEIEQEPKPTESGKPPAYWPASGDLEVENLSARYSPDGPEVLHNLNFSIKSGERIGVVGRTGSGKSSLTLALLRCIFTSGTIRYDGISTSDINLNALRSNITIIPQQPELMTGTLRQNLDPFGQYDDSTLNDALRSAGLFSLQEQTSDSDDTRIGLETSVASAGSNLSVGQRQILALARAIIRGSKLLILDEATSAIDYATDNIIQTSIRRELTDVTLITVAHRLQTIMDADRIMVLKAGNLEEYDTPANLLKNPQGLLRSLVDESGDRDKLYEMASHSQ